MTTATTTTMTAVVRDTYGEADDVLSLVHDLPVPRPDPGEVLVRVHAAGVDQGVWHVLTGRPYLVRAAYGIRRPRRPTIGRDVAGIVEAVGPKVTALHPGDRVVGTCDGAYAQYAIAKADRLVALPAAVPFDGAAAIPTSGLAALQGLRRSGRIRAGQRVLVLGAGGGVGSFAVQLAARVFDAHVTGVCSTGKTGFVRGLGAEEVVDYTREDPLGTGERYDLILATGGQRPLRALRGALTARGTLVLVGSEESSGRWLQGFDRQLRAALLSPFVGQALRPLLSTDDADDLRFLVDQVAAGAVVPAVDRTFPLAQTADAIRYLRERRVRGKAVMTVSSAPRRAKLDP